MSPIPLTTEEKQPEQVIKTLSFKLKNLSAGDLAFLSDGRKEVNFVWNYLNATSYKAIRTFANKATWLSAFDMNKLTQGCTYHPEDNPNGLRIINNAAVQCINQEYVVRRKQFRKNKLRFRKSLGSKASLGWIPFKQENVSISLDRTRMAGKGYTPEKIDFSTMDPRSKGNVTIKVLGRHFKVFNEVTLKKYLVVLQSIVKGGTLSEDSLGQWWLNLAVATPQTLYMSHHLIPQGYAEVAPMELVGIDLGLDRFATTSHGEIIETPRIYRSQEKKLGMLQRRAHKKQAKRLHRRMKRQRRDFACKQAVHIAKTYQFVKVGDLGIAALKRGNAGKSFSDQGLGIFKKQLSSICRWAGRGFALINESYSTQVCSNCDCICGPKGLKQLDVRSWVCVNCGVENDRDTCGAQNIERTSVGSTLLKTVPRCWHPSAGILDTQKVADGLLSA